MTGSSTLVQLARFVIVGCANTAIGFGTILAMRYAIGASDLVANFLGFAVGITASFLLNRNFTFGDRGAVGPSLVRFAISVGIAYLINVGVLLFFLRALDAASLVSQLAGVFAYTITLFLLAKFFAFAAGSPRSCSLRVDGTLRQRAMRSRP